MDSENKKLTPDRLALEMMLEISGSSLQTSSHNDCSSEKNGDLEVAVAREKSNDSMVEAADQSAQFASAIRVMELLHRAKPNSANSLTSGFPANPQNLETVNDASSQATPCWNDWLSLPFDTLNNLNADRFPVQIDRFQIRSLIGQGGYGLVFKAFDPLLDRVIALKIPTLSAILKPDALARFQREGRTVALLSHPNIVPVFEVGTDNGISFIASEWIAGSDLAQVIDSGGVLKPKQAARIVEIIAETIHHAHQRGVVHRDLKPANVLVRTTNDNWLEELEGNGTAIQVTDFGLAQVFDQSDHSVTKSGSLIGTPGFAAPEQLSSGSKASDSKSADIYSLGAVMYFLLTGRPPFEAESLVDLAHKIRNQPPTGLRSIRSDVPRDLESVCLKCLHICPADRYRSSFELSQDLNRFLLGQPVQARTIAWPIRAGRWIARNRVVTSLVGMILLSISLGLVATFSQWQLARQQLKETLKQQLRSEQLLISSGESIDRMLNHVSEELRDIPGMSSIREQVLKDALEIQTSILNEEKLNSLVNDRTVASHVRLGRIQHELGQKDEAMQSLKSALKLYEQLKTPSVECQIDASFAHWQMGLIELGQANMEQADWHADAALLLVSLTNEETPDDRHLETCLGLSLSAAFRLKGQIAEADKRPENSLENFENAVITLSQLEADCEADATELQSKLMSAYNSLAIAQKATGNVTAAKENYEYSIRINEQLIVEFPDRRTFQETLALTSINLANLVYREFTQAESRKHYQRAVEILSNLRAKYPRIADYQRHLPAALHGLSSAQMANQQFQLARQTIEQSIEIMEEASPALETTQSRYSLAVAYKRLALLNDEQLEDYERADAAFESAAEIYSSLVENDTDNVRFLFSMSLGQIGQAQLLLKRKKFEAAVPLLEDVKKNIDRAQSIDPAYQDYQTVLQQIRAKRALAWFGTRQTEKSMAEFRSVDLRLESNQLVEWAAHSTQAIEILRSQEDSGGAETESMLSELKQLTRTYLLAAKENGFEEFNALRDDKRFAGLIGDSEFQEFLEIGF